MLTLEELKHFPIFSILKKHEHTLLCISAAHLAFNTFCKVLKTLWGKIKSFFITSVEINSRDESYEWVIEWINSHPSISKSKSLAAVTTYVQFDDDDNRPRVILVPNVGNYVIHFKGYCLWVNISPDEGNSPDILARFGSIFGVITISTFGSRQILEELIDEAMQLSLKKEEGRTVIYTSKTGYWKKFGSSRPKRPLSSVILKDGLKESILEDIRHFLNSSKWYYERGIPYRRGYLLHGPPGTGKTSLVSALAGELGMSICVINLNNFDLNDEQLVMLFNQTPGKKCILLIEDIDVAPSSVSREKIHTKGISLSGLLNAIDGIAGQEGRILFMTTNRPEQIDSALTRPGRVDMKVHIDLTTKYQLKYLFLNFFPGFDAQADTFSQLIPEGVYSSAQIQGFFMEFKDSPDLVVDNLAKLKDILPSKVDIVN